MKKIVFFTVPLLCVALYFTTVTASSNKTKHSYYTEMPTYEWMRNFHNHKDLDNAPNILKQQSQNGAFDYNNYVHHNYITTFWAMVFHTYPNKAQGIINAANITDKMTLEKIKYSLYNAKHETLPTLKAKIDDTFGQDLYWAAYHVTGDKKYLIPMLDVLEKDRSSFAGCLIINPVDSISEAIAHNMKYDNSIAEFLESESSHMNNLAQTRIKKLLQTGQ
jgi:hypothetical protein